MKNVQDVGIHPLFLTFSKFSIYNFVKEIFLKPEIITLLSNSIKKRFS